MRNLLCSLACLLSLTLSAQVNTFYPGMKVWAGMQFSTNTAPASSMPTSNLVAWFKPDALGLSNGTTAGTNTDWSGNGNHLTGASTPIYLAAQQNGLGALVWTNGAGDNLYYSTCPLFANSRPVFIAAVIKIPAAVTSTGCAIVTAGMGGSGGWELRVNSTLHLEWLSVDTVSIATSTGTVTAGQWYIVGVGYDALGNYNFFVNGAASGSGLNNVDFAGFRTLVMGINGSDGGEPYNYGGLIGEVAIFNSASEPAGIWTYLNDRWKIY